MDDQYLKSIIECMIFISDKPVSIKRIQGVLIDVKKSDINKFMDELVSEWKGLDRGFNLVEVAGGFQFRTNPDYGDFILKFKESKPFRLSKAALEVLSIVAYKQPITRLEIEQIRGVDSSSVIGLLLSKRFIEIKGRKDVIGRPFIYGTTSDFLETFGLKSIGDLPTLGELEEIETSIQRTSEGFYE